MSQKSEESTLAQNNSLTIKKEADDNKDDDDDKDDKFVDEAASVCPFDPPPPLEPGKQKDMSPVESLEPVQGGAIGAGRGKHRKRRVGDRKALGETCSSQACRTQNPEVYSCSRWAY